MALLGLIPTHLQWIFGLILYFLSPLGLSSLSGEAMSNSTLRLYSIEHPFTMILAVVLITIGFAKAKRGSDPQKTIYVYLGFLPAWPAAHPDTDSLGRLAIKTPGCKNARP